ncbi:MAG: DUF3488 domain-containing protein [Deltaproteobacteria bacterium]|nr:DUF3488 domain-containing protein [Deltaproteobacteria bacterium]
MRRINLLNIARILVYPALIGAASSIATEVHIVPLSVFGSAVLAGFLMDKRANTKPLIPPLIMLVMVIGSIIFSIIALTEENIFNRALGILLIIISAKLISPKRQRDLLQLYMLNFFLVSGSAVMRLDLEFAFLVMGEAFLSILGLFLIHGSNEQAEIPLYQVLKLARWSGIITLCLIPATIVIFLIIPRPTMTFLAWGGGAASTTGFSDRVIPGAVSEIKVDPSPAFRVKWISGTRPEKAMWRGIVYDKYDMGVWERTNRWEIIPPDMDVESVQYELLLEPTDSRYLLTIGVPYRIEPMRRGTHFITGYTVETGRPRDGRSIYRVDSYMAGELPADSAVEFFLEVPADLKDYLISFSSDLVRDTDMNTAEAVEAFLKTGFSYALDPEEPSGEPVLYFLSTSKKGHCEYFASAMALLLRTRGIPARVVGGYLGGEWNDLGQYYLVRQMDAHAWVEAWIKGLGWVTFDPTPGTPLSLVTRGSLYRFVDMLRLKWYYWVLNYDISRQIELAKKSSDVLKSLRYGNIRFSLMEKLSSLKYILTLLLIPFVVILYKVTVRHIRNRPATYGERFVALLRHHGYHKVQGETLLEFGKKISTEDPSLENSIMQFVKGYYQAEYGACGIDIPLSRMLRDLKTDLLTVS